MDPETVTHLKTWRKHQATALEQAGLTNELGLVFTGSHGAPLHPHLASQAFARAHKGLAVTPIRFHDICHTHATLLRRIGRRSRVVSERPGHSNPAFTMATYQHVLPGMHAGRRRPSLRRHHR